MDIRKIWSPEKEAMLIELVRQNPNLWDRTDTNYTKKKLKKFIYATICENLKNKWPNDASMFNSAAVHVKFSSLKTYFQKELRKRTTAEGDLIPPKWMHFNKMLFLLDGNIENKSESDLNISITTEQNHKISSEDKDFTIEAQSRPSLPFQMNENEDSSLNAAAAVAASFSDSEDGLESSNEGILEQELQPSLQSNHKIIKPSSKRKRRHSSSSVQDSITTEAAAVNRKSVAAERLPTFNVALGNLVSASLTQMPVEKANAATKEIFDILLKYGSETNNLR